MQYKAATASEYFEELERDWRRDKLLELHALIQKHGPELEASMKYGALSYGGEKGGAFGLNAQKASVNLYVGNAKKVDPTGDLLEGLSCGKGCIRFTKSVVVAETNIEAFIAKAMSMWRRGEYFGC
jgi:uncharacterized protein YdhG (YjbR/CyaY superfamily)